VSITTIANGGGLVTKERAMSFPGQHRPVSIRPFFLTLLSATALFATVICCARARDFEMGGDGNYNIMAPEPGTGPHHVVRSRHGRTSSRHSQSTTASQQSNPDTTQDAAQSTSPAMDTPEQIETFKHNRRAYVGSSGLVLPTPLPGPTHYAPIGTGAGVAVNPLPREQSPTILPGSGRAIPNLPHGPETFQDRASRCAFQSSINSIPGSQASSYMHSCAM
jgi:hypothetical protein